MEKLKQQKIWVCWRYEAVKGRRTKVLYSVKGYKTGTTEKYTSRWATYDEVLKAKKNGSYDGIGFILPTGVVAIDIDHISDEDSRASDLKWRLKTYAEFSPSKTGIHYIATVDLSIVPQSGGKVSPEYYVKNPHNEMEVYFGGLTNRYPIWNAQNDTIFGKPVITTPSMPTASTGAKPIAFGDLSYYWVIERQPLAIKRLNEMYAVQGQIGFSAYERLDGKLIMPEAVKVLKMA